MQVDVRLDEVVLRALEKEPDRRYQQASQVKTEVENIVRTPPVIGGQPAAPPLVTPAPAASPVPQNPPRFSRCAIWGAIWAVFIFFDLLVYFFFIAGPRPILSTWRFGIFRTFGLLIMFFPGLIGLTAPFGTTILGWMGIAQIRKSAGRVQGLGLAVFDGVLFPLLLISGFIFTVFLFLVKLVAESPAGERLRNHGNGEIFLMLWLLMSFVTSGAAGFFIVRAVWHALNRSSGESGTTDNSARLSPLAIAATACAIVTTLMIVMMLTQL